MTKNILRCLRNGTQMGWLIDPEDKAVFVYRPNQEIEILDEPDTVLPMPSFLEKVSYRVSDLFGLLIL